MKKSAEHGFMLGRYYEHASGGQIHIVGSAYTHSFGFCLVAEEKGSAHLRAIGIGPDYSQHWFETDPWPETE